MIGEEVAQWRKENGYKQEGFARAVGIQLWQVRDLEQGKRMPTWEEIYLLKAFMGVDDDFFATSDMIKRKTNRNKKPLDRDVGKLVGKIMFWHNTTPYCQDKEDDLKAIGRVVARFLGNGEG